MKIKDENENEMAYVLFAVSVGINYEAKRDTAEAGECGNGSGVGVVSGDKVHHASAHDLTVVGGVSQVAEAEHGDAARRTRDGVR